ncbi:MAG: hypothetical protein KGI33_11715 [Thaumarchaeota archaeon]|nr:hypothetical protein [Nitrososphaerota archaeon]
MRISKMNRTNWDKAVDGITVLWFGNFFVGFFSFDAGLFGLNTVINIPKDWQPSWDIISWAVWVVFIVDICFKYKTSENCKIFLKKHWFDILLLIPFFRVIRLVRLLRLLKTLKFAKAGIGGSRAFSKSKRFKNSILYSEEVPEGK